MVNIVLVFAQAVQPHLHTCYPLLMGVAFSPFFRTITSHMDRYQIASYLKALRRKETFVWLGLVVVLSVISTSFFWFLFGPKPQPLPIPPSTITGSGSALAVIETLPSTGDLVLAQNDEGQAVPSNLPVKYRVKSGDSTWKIAQAFFGTGYNYVDIEKANNLKPDQNLEIGQELTIPQVAVKTLGKPNQAEHELSASSTYTVKSGDSLWRIAQVHYGHGRHWPTLYRQNRAILGTNPNLIFPGTALQLVK